MADFRKWIPVLAVMALLLGSAITASAQPFTCSVGSSSTTNTLVRAEGIAELVGDVLIDCTGGTPTMTGTAITQVNIQIFLNTNVTSKILNTANNLTEALILIDEPAVANQRPCTSAPTPCTFNGTSTVAGVPGATSPYLTGSGANIFQGQLAANNSLLWLGVPIDPPGSTGHRFVRITNVRANANQLGVSSTLIPTQISMFITATPSTGFPLTASTVQVASVQTGLSFSVAGGAASLTQCTNPPNTDPTSPAKAADAYINFAEGFPTAFKTRVLAGGQATPGGNYGTESGFYNPALTASNGLPTAGLADNATRLMAKFSALPAGVTLYVSTTQVGINGTKGTISGPGPTPATTAALVATDASGANTSAGTVLVAATASATDPLNTANKTFGIAPITSTGTNSGIAVWEIQTASANTQDTLQFGVYVVFTANTAQGIPGLGTGTVGGTFAPVSTVTTASSTAPVPRFADTSGSNVSSLFSIAACVTDILFPFVTNQANFDTGIAIANTSLDPFATTSQSGPCTLYYFGNTTGGGAAPATQTTGTVAAGSVLVFTLSTGGTGVTATPGFQGYMIATCNFQYAHAFAFISDLGAQKLAEGYLGLIIDQGGTKISRGAVGATTGPTSTNAESTKF